MVMKLKIFQASESLIGFSDLRANYELLGG